MSSYPRGRVALVTGANGITGNAIVEHLVRQPKSEWLVQQEDPVTQYAQRLLTSLLQRSKIIVTSRRTTTQVIWQDPRVRYIALDFLKPVAELCEAMAPLCYDATHAFFASYVHVADFKKLRDYNVPMFRNFLLAIDAVAAKSLQRVCVQTGGKVRPPSLLETASTEYGLLTAITSTTGFIWGPLRFRSMKGCSGTKTMGRTSTTSRKISCLIWLRSATGPGTLFDPMLLLASLQRVWPLFVHPRLQADM